jgi:hypothetical protein
MIRSTRDDSSVTRLLANIYPFFEKVTKTVNVPKYPHVQILQSNFLLQEVEKSQQG